MAWCPWLSANEAMQLIDTQVAKMQEETPNLCPILTHRESIQKVPFGYTEKVSYDCTVVDSVYGIQKSFYVVFVSFYKGLIGIPDKAITIKK